MSSSEREGAIEAIMQGGKTREQAEAFLAILGSGLRRRGLLEGEPLSQDEIGRHLDTFLTSSGSLPKEQQ